MSVTIICHDVLEHYFRKTNMKYYQFKYKSGVDDWIYVKYSVNRKKVNIKTFGHFFTKHTIMI